MLLKLLKSTSRLTVGFAIINSKINALDLPLGYRQTVHKMGGYYEKSLRIFWQARFLCQHWLCQEERKERLYQRRLCLKQVVMQSLHTQTVTTMLQIICLRPQAQCMETYQAAISVKFDVNDKIAVGFAQYNQAGISLNYQGAGSQIPGFNAVGTNGRFRN